MKFSPSFSSENGTTSPSTCAKFDNTILLAYVIVAIICSSILMIMYARTLLRAIKGSKYRFIVKSLVGLIVSNIGTLMIVTANYKMLV